mgnify:CR=1 FL=1
MLFRSSVLRLNLFSTLHASQAANAVMQQQDGGGVIVCIGSISALRPSPGTAAYGAAKAARAWASCAGVSATTQSACG